ncbi:unnamed protein product [Linum trigynum]|uniref:Uncharacterized protein n=1 Tax=Linum trigynum TaxID=586398 RepID=A0AAV2F604_9ROSI
MRKICSGMMISTPRTISKLDLMKPSSKMASRVGTAVFDFHLPVSAHGKSHTARSLRHTAVCIVRAGRVCSRQNSHGQKYELHGRVICGCARVASFVTCLAPDLRPIDPKLAPESPFTY